MSKKTFICKDCKKTTPNDNKITCADCLKHLCADCARWMGEPEEVVTLCAECFEQNQGRGVEA